MSLDATILAVAVLCDQVFGDSFRDMVTSNPEGDVTFALDRDGHSQRLGVPFERAIIERLLNDKPAGQTSIACLRLACNTDTLCLTTAEFASTYVKAARFTRRRCGPCPRSNFDPERPGLFTAVPPMRSQLRRVRRDLSPRRQAPVTVTSRD